MECDQCHVEIKPNEKCFTAVGMNICEKCNEKNNGTISLDFILDHIQKNE